VHDGFTARQREELPIRLLNYRADLKSGQGSSTDQ